MERMLLYRLQFRNIRKSKLVPYLGATLCRGRISRMDATERVPPVGNLGRYQK